ncbi:MAG TPA: helix-turn-helix transcriptional regulator [Conexibacter sp.]|nr:helix-turn-helix transcriptional regulator [Conexibacter sp.]
MPELDPDDEEPKEPDPFLIALGVVIRSRRERLGMTQAALGLEVGQSQRRVWEWEQGSRDLRLSGSLVPLAAALRMSITALVSAVEVEFHDAAA